MASLPSSQAVGSETVAYATLQVCVDREIFILSMGTKFTYTVPSFLLISVDVR